MSGDKKSTCSILKEFRNLYNWFKSHGGLNWWILPSAGAPLGRVNVDNIRLSKVVKLWFL